MLFALPALALAEPCESSDWLAEPVSTALAPVRTQPLLHHRELMAQVSAGPGASPMYRVAWSRMDAELALQSHGFDAPTFSDADASRYKDLSIVTATMAAERFANEWIDDSEVLSGVRIGVRTVVGPNLVLTREDDSVKLAANQQPMHRYPKQTRARLEERSVTERPSTLRLGAGSALVDQDEEDMATDIAVAWRAYVLGERWGVDAFRVAVDVADYHPSQRHPLDWSGAWSVQVRERVASRFTATGELRSIDGGWTPSMAKGGLNYQLSPTSRRWVLRTTYTYTLPAEERELLAEHRADVRVVFNGRWHMPTAPHRWPRGEDLEGEPAWFNELPPRGPSAPELIAQGCAEPDRSVAER